MGYRGLRFGVCAAPGSAFKWAIESFAAEIIRNSFCPPRGSASPVKNSKLEPRRWGLTVLSSWLLVASALALPMVAGNSLAGDAAPSIPPARIDLSAIGYHGLSRSARLVGDANLTLDFVDDDHLLFTFNPKKLLIRHADCPPDHNDHLVDAAVFEVSSGKVVRQTEWYVHDRRRYLWSLGSGRFLLRRLNDLYEVDTSLQEKLLFSSPKPLLWVTVAADGGQIVVETEDAGPAAKSKAKQAAQKRMVKIEFLDARTLAVQRTIKSAGIVNLEATSSGFADVSKMGGSTWLIRFGPTGKERRNIARVRTQCTPDVFYTGSNTLLIGRCAVNSRDYSVSAFTVTGHNLWRQHWSAQRYLPVVRESEYGSRFAFSTLRAPPVTSESTAENDGDAGNSDLEQNVQVLDTASGTRVLSVAATSALIQQNFSLSPDGSSLAVLHDSTIEIYQLPAVSEEERVKYLAAKADVPGFFMAPAAEAQEPDTEEAAFFAAERQPEPEGNAAPAEESSAAAVGMPATGMPHPDPSVPPDSKATSAKAEPKQPEAALELTLKVRAQIVAVDVVVTDSQGHPVKGLQRRDFAVTEDGKAQGVRYFKEVTETELPPPPPPEKKAPNVFTNDAQAPTSGPATLILFDLLNTPAQDRRTAQDQLLKFLKSKPKSFQFALCVLSDTLRVLHGLTPDENVLATLTLSRGAPRNSAPLQLAAEDKNRSTSHKEIAQDPDPTSALILDLLARGEAGSSVRSVDERIYLTLTAFGELGRYLTGFPGRKNLIWVSSSFPAGILAGQELPPGFSESEPLMNAVRKTTNLLADSNVAVYPVSVGGAQDADKVMVLSSDADTIKQAMIDENISQRSTMDEIALGTGGKAFFSTNGIDQAFAAASEQGSHYYALSYTPANKKFDGRYRKIKVTLAGREYHLTYRTGYYALDPDAPVKADMNSDLAAAQHGAPQSHQVLFAARVAPMGGSKAESKQVSKLAAQSKKSGPVEMQRYSIDYLVTPSQLRFGVAPDGTYYGAMSFVVSSFAADGKLLTRIGGKATSDLKQEDYKDMQTGGFRFHQEVEVPAAAGSLSMGVEDTMNGHTGMLEIPLPVPALPGGQQSWSRSLPEIEPD